MGEEIDDGGFKMGGRGFGEREERMGGGWSLDGAEVGAGAGEMGGVVGEEGGGEEGEGGEGGEGEKREWKGKG